MAELMVFKAGKYPQGDWPEERVQKLVNSYNPEKLYEAPLVIGHRSFGITDDYQDALRLKLNLCGWTKAAKCLRSTVIFR